MKRILILLAVILLAAGAAFAQTQDSHLINFNLTASALIDLDSAADWDVALALTALPADAGLPPTGGPYTTTRYLWYTVLSGGSAALIQANLDSALPAGLSLQLVATIGAGGAGTKGSGTTIATVDGTARNLVTGIGSCYTTRGATDGAAVAYTANMSGYTGTSIVRTLTYTISGW